MRVAGQVALLPHIRPGRARNLRNGRRRTTGRAPRLPELVAQLVNAARLVRDGRAHVGAFLYNLQQPRDYRDLWLFGTLQDGSKRRPVIRFCRSTIRVRGGSYQLIGTWLRSGDRS